MSIEQWAGFIVSAISIAAAFLSVIRWMIKHYLYELKPNGGGSMADRITRLEARLDDIYKFLLEK